MWFLRIDEYVKNVYTTRRDNRVFAISHDSTEKWRFISVHILYFTKLWRLACWYRIMCTLLIWNNFFELSKYNNVLPINYFCLLLIFFYYYYYNYYGIINYTIRWENIYCTLSIRLINHLVSCTKYTRIQHPVSIRFAIIFSYYLFPYFHSFSFL